MDHTNTFFNNTARGWYSYTTLVLGNMLVHMISFTGGNVLQ